MSLLFLLARLSMADAQDGEWRRREIRCSQGRPILRGFVAITLRQGLVRDGRQRRSCIVFHRGITLWKLLSLIMLNVVFANAMS